MPKETDKEALQLLGRLLLGAVGNVQADRRLWEGHSAEPLDVGLRRFFGKRATDRERLGDADMELSAETRYEFRFELEGNRVYVKTVLNCDDPDDPILVIKCLKLQD